jgi:quinol monooxygenase YgiN
MSEQRHVRIEYRVRPDVDLDALTGLIRDFVAGIANNDASHDYTSYRDAKDPRHFVHVASFEPAALAALQAAPFFQTFTKRLRESTVTDPEVTQLSPVASTRR